MVIGRRDMHAAQMLKSIVSIGDFDMFFVTEEVVSAPASGWGTDAIKFLFERTGDGIRLPITAAFLEAAAAGDPKAMRFLPEARGADKSQKTMLDLLFEACVREPPVTETVVVCSVGYELNLRIQLDVLDYMEEKMGASMPITEAVVMAAVSRHFMACSLLEKPFRVRGDKLPVTTAWVIQAAKHPERDVAVSLLRLLLNCLGDRLSAAESVLVAIAEMGPPGEGIAKSILLLKDGDLLAGQRVIAAM
ncbi:hypothetical protein OQA88_2559 [Cercophora sp. LCS_1]